MVDATIVGIIGTGVGAAIGFMGSTTQAWITAKATNRRETAARLFVERRTVYSDFLFGIADAQLRVSRIFDDRTKQAVEELEAQATRMREASAGLRILAPTNVRNLVDSTMNLFRALLDTVSNVNIERNRLQGILDEYRNSEGQIPDGSDSFLAPILIEQFPSIKKGCGDGLTVPRTVIDCAEKAASSFSEYAENHEWMETAVNKLHEQVREAAEAMRADLGILD